MHVYHVYLTSALLSFKSTDAVACDYGFMQKSITPCISTTRWAPSTNTFTTFININHCGALRYINHTVPLDPNVTVGANLNYCCVTQSNTVAFDITVGGKICVSYAVNEPTCTFTTSI